MKFLKTILVRIQPAGILIFFQLILSHSLNAGLILNSVLVADRNTVIPNDHRTFEVFGPAVTDGTNTVFTGLSTTSSNEPRQRGLYAKSSGQPLRRIVDTNSQAPGGAATFSSFSEAALDNGKIIFWGRQGSQSGALFVEQNGQIDYLRLNDGSVINQSTKLPGTDAIIQPGQGVGIAASDGNIAFSVITHHPTEGFSAGVYAVIDGELVRIADAQSNIPGGIPNGRVPSIDGDTVAFSASNGIYSKTANGDLTKIADKNTFLPDGIGTFDVFAADVAIEDNKIYFTGRGESNQIGIYEATIGGDIKTVVNQDSVVDGVNPDWGFGPGGTLSVDNGNLLFHGSETPPGINPATERGLFTTFSDEPTQLASSTSRGSFTTSQQALSGDNVVYRNSIAFDGTNEILHGRIGHTPIAQTVTELSTELPNQGRHLVVITHGWIPSLTTRELTEEWVLKMASDIKKDLAERGEDPDNWDIVPHLWLDAASTGLSPVLALAKGVNQGNALGSQIANSDYETVHFIAHSAGAGLITAAANFIEMNTNPDGSEGPEAHSTFLDPYKPIAPPGDYIVNQYGQYSDWADNYISDDTIFRISDDINLPFTQPELQFAHNVRVDMAVDSVPPIEGYAGHSGPVRFYSDTIHSPSNPNFEGYGYALSMEYMQDGWTAPMDHMKGNIGEELVTLGIGSSQPNPQYSLTIGDSLEFHNLLVNKSKSGLLILDNNGLTLHTGSPVWMTSAFELTYLADFLIFDYEFLNAANADGVLSIYLDDSLLGTIDERYEFSGLHQYISYFDRLALGIHTLGFRLDPYGDVPSSVRISDIRFGSINETNKPVPEPSSLALVLLGSFCCMLRRSIFCRKLPAT